MQHDRIIEAVRCWVDAFVVNLNLCPFAKRELIKDRVRFTVSDADSETTLLHHLQSELERLDKDDHIETTLLIHPDVLQDFHDYNQFLDKVDALLETTGKQGIYQVASFHPDYQFADTHVDDVENYSNRSPYPLLHLLRESSLEDAIERYPDTDTIPEQNIRLLNDMGIEKIRRLYRGCFGEDKE